MEIQEIAPPATLQAKNGPAMTSSFIASRTSYGATFAETITQHSVNASLDLARGTNQQTHTPDQRYCSTGTGTQQRPASVLSTTLCWNRSCLSGFTVIIYYKKDQMKLHRDTFYTWFLKKNAVS